MSGRVSLARRTLFQDRRRAGLAVAGVGAALLLVLLLDGIVDGSNSRQTAYLRASPANVIVSQQGIRTMHMAASVLPPETVTKVRKVSGVAWADGLRYASSMVSTPKDRMLSYIFGYEPAGHLGPQIVAGRAPRSSEALVDRVAADKLGLSIGGTVQVFGRGFTVSGLFAGGTNMINTIAFIPTEDYARLLGPAISYIFAGAQPGVSTDQLANRVSAALPQTTVQTRDEFVGHEAAAVEAMSGDVMQVMAMVGFLMALGVIGMTLFTSTLSRRREYAVVKALGSRGGRLSLIVFGQSVWLVSAAAVLATGVAVGGSELLGNAAPSLPMVVEPASVARVAVAALVAGALGALIPLRQVLRVDAATAFRRTS